MNYGTDRFLYSKVSKKNENAAISGKVTAA